jgi:hypothetical protein
MRILSLFRKKTTKTEPINFVNYLEALVNYQKEANIHYEYDDKLKKWVYRRYYVNPSEYGKPREIGRLFPEALTQEEREEALRLTEEILGITKEITEDLTKHGRIEIIRGIRGDHEQLKRYAKELLEKEGYRVLEEFGERIRNHRVIIDVVGIKERERIAIECGTLSREDKLELLSKGFDKVIWIPYPTLSLAEQLKFYRFKSRR